RARQRVPATIDNVATRRNEAGQLADSAGVIAECREPQNAQRDQSDDPGIDQHAEHQALVHDRQQLPALADQSEPLGPWRDESGRRCVHRSAVGSLEVAECLPPSGASGSAFASRTGFVTGFATSITGLSTI